MRNRFLAGLICVFPLFLTFTGLADNMVGGYEKGNKIVLSYSGGSGTAAFCYYDEEDRLFSVSLGEYDGKAYIVDKPNDYKRLKVWFVEADIITNVSVKEEVKETLKPTDTPVHTPAPLPTEEVIDEEIYEEQPTDEEEAIKLCKISINCETAIKSNNVSEAKKATLPYNGVMLLDSNIIISDEMTVYDVLLQVASGKGIEIKGDKSYIRGIGGLYEFDGGILSGWMFTINDEFVQKPIGACKVSENDVIKILYTCNMGNDL